MNDGEGPKPNLEELNKMAHIARLYYEHKLTQQDVAERTGLKQVQISRYLKLAEEHGIVVTKVDPYFTRDLEDQLRKAFPHLKDARVVPSMAVPHSHGDVLLLQELGKQCATHFCAMAPHATKIGVSCGHAVESAVSAIGALSGRTGPLPIACEVYPLIILMVPEMVGATSVTLVADLVRWLPEAKGEIFQLPSVIPDKPNEGIGSYYRKNPQISALLSKIAVLDYYMIGIGSISNTRPGAARRSQGMHEFNSLTRTLKLTQELDQLGAVGESLYQPFDNNGESLIKNPKLEPLRENILYLPLEVLHKHVQKDTATVVAVAGGESKRKAIRAALHAKIFDTLITDSLTADYVLQEESGAKG